MGGPWGPMGSHRVSKGYHIGPQRGPIGPHGELALVLERVMGMQLHALCVAPKQALDFSGYWLRIGPGRSDRALHFGSYLASGAQMGCKIGFCIEFGFGIIDFNIFSLDFKDFMKIQQI